jgi:ParB family chromosome partitioning protein
MLRMILVIAFFLIGSTPASTRETCGSPSSVPGDLCMRQLTTKPLSWFKAANVRRHFDEEELRLLGESLKQRQIHPVIAKPDGTLIDGERRLRAARLVGQETLDTVVTDENLTSEQVTEIQLVSAFHRAALTGWEQFEGLRALQAAHPEWKQQDLAERLHISAKMVRVIASVADCIPEVQDALKDRRIGISDCYPLSLHPAEEQAVLLARKLEGASRDDLVREGRKRRNGPVAAVRVSKIKCRLSSGVTITVSGDSISLDELIDALAEAQKEARKARDQNLDARTWQAVMRDKAKAAV